MSDQYVENMAVLLQSLDENGNANDGIVITAAMHAAFSDNSFNLATISEQELRDILFAETGEQAVSETEAMQHVGEMIEQYTNIQVEASEQQAVSEIFKWLGNENDSITDDVIGVELELGNHLELSDLLLVNETDMIEQFLTINFKSDNEQRLVDLEELAAYMIQNVTADVDLNQYVVVSNSQIQGLLHSTDKPIIVKDDSMVAVHDDLNDFIL